MWEIFDLLETEPLISYFSARKKPGGGFSAAKTLPATIEDTYYALKCLLALKERGCLLPSEILEGHLPFLRKKLREGNLSPRAAFQLSWSLKALGDQEKVPYLVPHRLELEDYYFLAALGHKLSLSQKRLKALLKTVRDVRMYLELFREKLSREEKRHWKAWLLSCQNPDGGFGFRPGTTSFVENGYHALCGLKILKTTPPDLDSIQIFVLYAQSQKGGFGRRHRGVPFPSSTWYAVATLLLLDSFS